MDTVLVIVIIALAAGFLVRRFFGRKTQTGCGCGCSGCGGGGHGGKPGGCPSEAGQAPLRDHDAV